MDSNDINLAQFDRDLPTAHNVGVFLYSKFPVKIICITDFDLFVFVFQVFG